MPRLAVALLTFVFLAAPLAAEAQQAATKVYRIAYLLAASPLFTLTGREPSNPLFRAFVQELRQLGYVEGQNLVIERRSAEGRYERLPDLAAELVRLKMDVIVAASGTASRAAKQATTTIPIVMAPGDLNTGLPTSLARPGGNITGLTSVVDDAIDGKCLELLKEVLPRMARVGVIHQTPSSGHPIATRFKDLIATAQALRVALVFAKADQADQVPDAFTTLAQSQVDGVFVELNPLTYANRRLTVDLAARHRLAAIYGFRETVEAGGLMSYSASLSDISRRAADYVDKILKGAKPADLPVEQPSKFELIINLKTAKTLGLTIPQSVLLRADEVIQ